MQAVNERADNIRMIRESAAAIVPSGDLKRIRTLRYTLPGFDPAVWREICGQGWLGLRISEADGGSGLGMQEYVALAEECGAGLLPEPLIAASLVARILPAAMLPDILSGKRLVLSAFQEHANALWDAPQAALQDGYVTGRKCFVSMAAGADAFVMTTAGGLALVARDAPGMTLATDLTQDGGHYGTLVFNNTPATAIPADLADAFEEATLATAGYLLGVTERAFAMTLDYLRTRVQFGQPIGSFQALQHRAADMKIQLALTRASVEAAAATLDSDATLRLRRAAVSRAKARASDAALLIGREAVQMHGGIGYTDEYDVGLYLRKAMVLAGQFGSPMLHRARYAELAPDDESNL